MADSFSDRYQKRVLRVQPTVAGGDAPGEPAAGRSADRLAGDEEADVQARLSARISSALCFRLSAAQFAQLRLVLDSIRRSSAFTHSPTLARPPSSSTLLSRRLMRAASIYIRARASSALLLATAHIPRVHLALRFVPHAAQEEARLARRLHTEITYGDSLVCQWPRPVGGHTLTR
jgi:hypothetical protein